MSTSMPSPYRQHQQGLSYSSPSSSNNNHHARHPAAIDEFEFDDERPDEYFFEAPPSVYHNNNNNNNSNRNNSRSLGGIRRSQHQQQQQQQQPQQQQQYDDFLLQSDDGIAMGPNSDTDEASEAEFNSHGQRDENEPMEIKEQMYQDKLDNLRHQMDELKGGNHPEYLRRAKKLDAQYRERLRLNAIYRDYLAECVERDYTMERRIANKEYEERRVDLKENLITDFEDKRKQIEAERHSMELAGDTADVKPTVTRKLRRRPNDPVPVAAEKRRKPTTGTLVLLLDEKEIDSDLKLISRGKAMTPNAAAAAIAASVTQTSVATSLLPASMMQLGHSDASSSAADTSQTLQQYSVMGGSMQRNSNGLTIANTVANVIGSLAGGFNVQQQQQQQTHQLGVTSGSSSRVPSAVGSPAQQHGGSSSVAAGTASSALMMASPPGIAPHDDTAAANLVETRIEDGKLLYERRWYHRGQPVYVEGKDMNKFAGTVSAIGSDVVWVKKLVDNSKVKINTYQLSRGKIAIKRRAN